MAGSSTWRDGAGFGVTYVVQDMRRIYELASSFGAVICLWQSFGYFDDATNVQVLRQINQTLRPRGRFILDLYHRGFFEQHQETRSFERSGLVITERKALRENRLTVCLEYGSGGGTDTFEWRLYTPDEIFATAEQNGFTCLAACARFDEHTSASPDEPRMQLVLGKQSP